MMVSVSAVQSIALLFMPFPPYRSKSAQKREIIRTSLIILFVHFKITLWMVYIPGTPPGPWFPLQYVRSCGISHTFTSLFSKTCAVSIFFQECAISLFVMLLDFPYRSEFRRKLRETFLLRAVFCKAFIHIGPFVILARCSSSQIFFRITDSASSLKPHFHVSFSLSAVF